MPRIGIDARLYGVASGTGIGRYTEELLRALATLPSPISLPEGDDLTFIVFLRRDGYEAFTPPDTRWTKVLADFRPYSLAAQTAFPRVIRQAGVDCMHFTHFDHPRTYRGPFLVTIHDLILLHHPSIRTSTLGPIRFWSKYVVYRSVLQHATHHSWRIFTPSRTVQEQIVKTFGVLPEKIITTHLGTDHAVSTPLLSNVHRAPSIIHPPYLLYIGNCYPHKNVEQLIRVLPTVRAQYAGMQLVLVGRADDFARRLQHQYRGVDGIVFAGTVNDTERTQLLRDAHAYVTASNDEGFALPPVEALAVETPVVASDIPIHREVLGTHATFFPQNDDRALVAAITTALSPRHTRAIVEGSRHAAQFTWRACAVQTLAAYREVAALLAHRA